MKIFLKRIYNPKSKDVRGFVIIYKNGEFHTFDTLENADYTFPAGVYRLIWEYSPKFKRNLWELYDIPGRSEIKFHAGASRNHSKGCILLRSSDVDSFNNMLDSSAFHKIQVE